MAHALTEDEHKYGIPELKKFPMPDANHVRSAIKFFNYVTPAYEKELARAILKRMKEYGMSFDDFTVGEENRFSKYIPDNFLQHHGIQGMHWGIRRYQNPDGSLTAAGRKRYDADSKKLYKSLDNYQSANSKKAKALTKYLNKSKKGFGFTTDKDINRARAKYVSAEKKESKAFDKYNKQYSKMEKRYWSKGIEDVPAENISRGRSIANKVASNSGSAKLKDLPNSTINYGEELLKKKK